MLWCNGCCCGLLAHQGHLAGQSRHHPSKVAHSCRKANDMRIDRHMCWRWRRRRRRRWGDAAAAQATNTLPPQLSSPPGKALRACGRRSGKMPPLRRALLHILSKSPPRCLQECRGTDPSRARGALQDDRVVVGTALASNRPHRSQGDQARSLCWKTLCRYLLSLPLF